MSGSGQGRLSKTIEKPAHHADMEREAALWEEGVLPRWEQALVPQLVEATQLPAQGSVLVAECRTGFLAQLVAQATSPEVRCIAIEPSREMLDIARSRRDTRDRRIWWDARRLEKLPYQPGVFGASLCSVGIFTKDELHRVTSELVRVTMEGGAVSLMVPLASCFSGFYDLFREGLLALKKEGLEGHLDAFLDNLMTMETLKVDLLGAGMRDAQVHKATLPLTFTSGESFLLSPVVGALFLPYWLQICPDPAGREQLFFYITQALDTYFHGLEMTLDAEVAWVLGRA